MSAEVFWYEVDVDPDDCDEDGCSSDEEWNDVYLIVRVGTASAVSRNVLFEGACFDCEHYNGYTYGTVAIPIEANNVVVCCEECKEPIFRVEGIYTKEWRLFIPEYD